MAICVCGIFIGSCIAIERKAHAGVILGIGIVVWRYVVGAVADFAGSVARRTFGGLVNWNYNSVWGFALLGQEGVAGVALYAERLGRRGRAVESL